MKFLFQWPVVLLAALLFFSPASALAEGQAYDAPLPEKLASDPDLCAYVPCSQVLPGAGSFSPRKGSPAYVEGYRADADDGADDEHDDDDDAGKTLVGYVFLSTDIVDIPGYSGQPIVTLIGMDTQGVITGVQVLRHAEPILLLGIPEGDLIGFIAQYVGQHVGDRIQIGKSQVDEDTIGLDAISGATVTVIAENQVILQSAMRIARQVGIVKPVVRPKVRFAPADGQADWATLVEQGGIGRLTVNPRDVGGAQGDQPLIDMHFGYLNAPAIGRPILGDSGYQRLMAELKPDEHAIFIVSNGTESFKGSGFVRGGIFDRIHLMQEMDSFTFRDRDYQNLYDVHAPGAPAFRESAIFIVRGDGFSPGYPWSLVFLANHVDTNTGTRTFLSFDQEYWLPDGYIVGGRPFYERPAALWKGIWSSRTIEIVLFVLLLAAAGTLYASRDWFVRRASRKDTRWVTWPKYVLWVVSIGYAGFYLKAVPSITQVLTWFHSILFDWQWSLFLSDPFLFLFWIFVIVTTFFWGRGMFCGWLCPYGALTEIAFRLTRALGLKRFQRKLSKPLHDKLKWLKYGIFVALLGVSFYSIGLAERLAEIEPFKTTFLVGVWNRSWPFVLLWAVLFIPSFFVERPFCKYLCPLGAGLAIPSTFRWWGLKRKQECTTCHACAAGCDSQSIDSQGRIDPRECMLCMDCMILYYDDHACPPLVTERKRRTRAGLELSRIGSDGYFIPLQLITDGTPLTAPAVVAEAPLPQAAKRGVLAWLAREIIDHLIPWDRKFLGAPLLLRAGGVGLAVLVTWVWLLGASGRLGPGIVLGWWLAWSAYELVTRMQCKPRVKEGPWWGHHLRPATWADMASYVAMKNLLIGAALFLLMRGTGVLDVLRGLPELQWLH